ncbi:MAG: lipoate--protein ligase [Clostridia bacterium]|nr:lipoate--protein ligase [Clostridia bacterium]
MRRIVLGAGFCPYHNLALEECLFEACAPGEVTLYLWQNEHTVVIGRNQNAYRECRTQLLAQEGGNLARRSTGGGAVYHDLGNLNFSFIASKESYDLPRQLGVVVKALARLGVEAQFTGRNDITLPDGAKISGSAFLHGRTADMQHGTLLVSASMDRLARYLAPSPEKLSSKGVDSVRSRVRNISDVRDSIDVNSVGRELCAQFEREYGRAERVAGGELRFSALCEKEARHRSHAWRYGGTRSYDVSLSHRFDWGELELQFTAKGAEARCVGVSSDCMDADFIDALRETLLGQEAFARGYVQSLRDISDERASQIAEWFAASL